MVVMHIMANACLVLWAFPCVGCKLLACGLTSLSGNCLITWRHCADLLLLCPKAKLISSKAHPARVASYLPTSPSGRGYYNERIKFMTWEWVKTKRNRWSGLSSLRAEQIEPTFHLSETLHCAWNWEHIKALPGTYPGLSQGYWHLIPLTAVFFTTREDPIVSPRTPQWQRTQNSGSVAQKLFLMLRWDRPACSPSHSVQFCNTGWLVSFCLNLLRNLEASSYVSLPRFLS